VLCFLFPFFYRLTSNDLQLIILRDVLTLIFSFCVLVSFGILSYDDIAFSHFVLFAMKWR